MGEEAVELDEKRPGCAWALRIWPVYCGLKQRGKYHQCCPHPDKLDCEKALAHEAARKVGEAWANI